MFVVVLSAHHHTRAESGPQIIHRSPLGLWVISTAQLVLRQGSQLGPIAHKVSRHKRCHLTLNHIIQKIPTYSKHAILLTSHLVQNKSSFSNHVILFKTSNLLFIFKTSHLIQNMLYYSKLASYQNMASYSKHAILLQFIVLKQVILYFYSKHAFSFNTSHLIQNMASYNKTWHLTQNMPSYSKHVFL